MVAAATVIRLIQAAADMIDEAVREAGPLGAPSGAMYAALSAHGLRLDHYQQILSAMEEHGRVHVVDDLVFLGRAEVTG